MAAVRILDSRGVARGIDAMGYDINPVAVLIGRSRLLSADMAGSLMSLGARVWQHAQSHPIKVKSDPLGVWFGSETAREIRSIERAIHSFLVSEQQTNDHFLHDDRLPQTSVASIFYVALFNMVRVLIQRYIPSNPAWVKRPDGRRIGISPTRLEEAFNASISRFADYLAESSGINFASNSCVSVTLGSSTALPLPDASVDAVISSPPYCTRLDYVKATLPELAVLGLLESETRSLRDKMIGTPTINSASNPVDPPSWGDATNRLLKAIEAHPSKASSGYYSKYYRQYFTGMWDSLLELRRVTKPGKHAVLVVQDSYYKNVHVDLPALVCDMGRAAGWAQKSRIDFEVSQTMATLHPGSKMYQRPTRFVESAIILERVELQLTCRLKLVGRPINRTAPEPLPCRPPHLPWTS